MAIINVDEPTRWENKMTYRNPFLVIFLASAKFLKLEQLDQDAAFPMDTGGVSVDGTGQVGTYFYTAPEIEQGWPKIDEKVNVAFACAIFQPECFSFVVVQLYSYNSFSARLYDKMFVDFFYIRLICTA